jgi:hypothetical protein
MGVCVCAPFANNFYFLKFLYYNQHMFESFPLSIRQLKATESRLAAIYDAAKMGLTGDTLALAAGMLPAEYRALCQLDPVAEHAAIKGKADGEAALSKVMHEAAMNGDARAALEILKHKHAWTAAQAITVDIKQQISIISALEQAQTRVVEGLIIDEADYRANDNRPLINHREKDGDDFHNVNPRQAQRATDL